MNIEQEVLRYARQYAGNSLKWLPVGIRMNIRKVIVSQLEFEMSPQKLHRPYLDLAATLFDEFGMPNLDWHSVAQTEVGECRLQGFIASQPTGATVRWMEPYEGTCQSCMEMNGRVFMVVVPDAPENDWATQVWRGKSRVHSEATRDIPDNNWPSAGLQHPGCRGVWASVQRKSMNASTDFSVWLNDLLSKP